jgi:hypothetical protein
MNLPYRNAMAESVKAEVLNELSRNGYYQAGGRGFYFQARQPLVDSIKAEVMAQIEAEQEMLEQRRERAAANYYARPLGTENLQRLNARDRERLKQEILWDLRPDLEEYSSAYFDRGRGNSYYRSGAERTMASNIKNELLAEIDAANYDRPGAADGWRNMVSERNIDRLINQHYRNLDNLRGDIRQELEAIRDIEKRMNGISDPQVREAVRSVVWEARQEGVPLDEVIKRLNERVGMGWGQRVGSWFNSSQGRGFLWGIGATVVATMLFPATRNGLRNVAVKMMEGTMNLAEQANTTFGRAKEGFEDMIAEANFNSLQEENQSFNENENPSETDNPQNEDPIH